MRAAKTVKTLAAAVLCLLGLRLPALAASPSVPAPSSPPSSTTVEPRDEVRVGLEEGLAVTLSEERGIAVEASPRRGEGMAAFAQRLCGDAGSGSRIVRIAEANAAAGAGLQAGSRYSIPFDLLSPDWQLKASRALFADDRGEADGWLHKVRGVGPMQRESLWNLAVWFTGTGENFRAIREYNELHDEDPPRGTLVKIPSELLRPAFRPALPVPEKPYLLDYGADKDGEFAVYRL
ncbi:MAG TPA: hypothetical protein VGH73_17495, partial [Thermoanaerobaculia bacterium]